MYETTKKSQYCILIQTLNRKLRYFGDNSTLHGVRYIFSKTYIPFYKRLFWSLILTASGACAAAVLLPVLSLYSQGSMSYFVDTNYLEFDTPFPAVTICEQPNGESKGLKAYVSSHNVPGSYTQFLKDISFWSAKCKSCPTCNATTCDENFYQAVDHIRMKCADLLTDCWWGNKHFSCCERFHPIETEYGVCFVFNSRLLGNNTSLIVNRKIGLPDLVFTAVEDVGIRIHSPDDMVSVGMENLLGRPLVLPLITDFDVILSAEQTISEISLSSMSPATRGCLFNDEKPASDENWPFQHYSYNTCLMFCRAKAQMSACNCTHHLMPKMRGIPFCDIQGFTCLSKIKDALGSMSCSCAMSCNEINYKLVHMFIFRHTGTITAELAARGTMGRVRLAQLPAYRVRRDAIRHILGLVVDIGGVGGVFFGASLLNVIEIIYLFCIRRHS